MEKNLNNNCFMNFSMLELIRNTVVLKAKVIRLFLDIMWITFYILFIHQVAGSQTFSTTRGLPVLRTAWFNLLIAHVQQGNISWNWFVILKRSLVWLKVKLYYSLGEMWKQFTTLLHGVISAHEVRTNISCTEEKCAWIDKTSKAGNKTFDQHHYVLT